MIEALTNGDGIYYVSGIRAAKEWGKRPTSVIAHDDWFGHRNPFTGEPLPGRDKNEWVDWDYALMRAYQMIQDNTTKSGLLTWRIDAEYVEVDAVKKIDKFQAAIDSKTSGKNYKPEPGESYVPQVWSRRKDENGKEVFPTFAEWVKGQKEDG